MNTQKSQASNSPQSSPRWEISAPVPEDYVSAVGYSRLIAQLLYNRNVKAEQVPSYVDPEKFTTQSPFVLPGVSDAVNRIYKAIRSGEIIGVYGDFDVDGVTSTAVLMEAITIMGGRTIAHIPDRFTDSHGLKASGVKSLKERGASLVITCDCGISDLAEAEKSVALGIDLLITDHHVPLSTLPSAVAVVNAKRKDSTYAFREFAGVGIAYKLMQALFHGDSRAPLIEPLLELVALGTVADMVSLTGENRQFVQKGLTFLNETKRPGVQALIRMSGLTLGAITSGDISWALGPRINAAGRLDHANTSLQLLMTESEEEAATLAAELDATNMERQRLTTEVYDNVKEHLLEQTDSPIFVAADEDYPEGVIGLVAGKVSKEYYRPTVIITIFDDLSRGSSRSIPEFDMVSALDQCADLLVSFGGHPLAAGFSLKKEDIPEFRARLTTIAHERLAGVNLSPRLRVDAEVSLKDLSEETFQKMKVLEPFGQHNPQPCFVSRGVEVLECRSFRNHERWMNLKLLQDGAQWEAVDFRTLRCPEEVPTLIDVAYTLRMHRWNGNEVLQAYVQDMAPSTV
ncbi:MAG: single-stranded-DNA-specific exonuclease RecJ [Dehalococcoidia bacterium]|nr:single-stranded-DNA-specific exonuclease RecJ [Dehalococcoidia bacterium]